MPDYANGKVYKIEADGILPYVGSTAEKKLCYRYSGHNRLHRYYLKTGKGGYCKSYELLKQEGCKITLIENFPCKSIEELKARERYWIDNIDCINKNRPVIDREEKVIYQLNYYQVNKEKLIQKSKTYYQVNKEAINQKRKEEYAKN